MGGGVIKSRKTAPRPFAGALLAMLDMVADIMVSQRLNRLCAFHSAFPFFKTASVLYHISSRPRNREIGEVYDLTISSRGTDSPDRVTMQSMW